MQGAEEVVLPGAFSSSTPSLKQLTDPSFLPITIQPGVAVTAVICEHSGEILVSACSISLDEKIKEPV